MLIMRRDAPLSTIGSQSSCSQSDRDATTFSGILQWGSLKIFTCLNMSPFDFSNRVRVSCILDSKFHVCVSKICTTSELLARQGIQTSTVLSTWLYNSQSWTFLLSLFNTVLRREPVGATCQYSSNACVKLISLESLKVSFPL